MLAVIPQLPRLTRAPPEIAKRTFSRGVSVPRRAAPAGRREESLPAVRLPG